MAICEHCGGEMSDGISCLTDPIVIDGRAYLPVRWGQEPRPRHRYEPEECRDCSTPIGGVHHPGCCLERCPACHGELLREHQPELLRCAGCGTAYAVTGEVPDFFKAVDAV